MKPVAVALLFAVVSPTRAEDDPKKVQESLQGEWRMVELIRDGRPEPKEEVRDTKATFKGNQLSMQTGKRGAEVSSFTLDPKANPPAIDLKPTGEKFTVRGIYKLEKDTLTLCFSFDGKDRPKEFKSEKGRGIGMVVLERVKK